MHVFFAGSVDDLVTIEAMLATMPLCTYGQVVIESDETLPVLELPRRVQLRRVPLAVSSFTGEPLPGEAIARAADAWLDEWIPEEPSAKPCAFYAWLGCEGSSPARDAAHRVEHSLRAGLSRS